MGIVINKAGAEDLSEVYSLAKEADMEILGAIPFDEKLSRGSVNRDSALVVEALSNLYFRLNLPQENI